jgi:hypothetical protein
MGSEVKVGLLTWIATQYLQFSTSKRETCCGFASEGAAPFSLHISNKKSGIG